MLLLRLKQLVHLGVLACRHPGALKALVSWKPFSRTCYENACHLARLNVPFRTIIDGGANIGQFARAVAEFFPKAEIISFEPLPEAVSQFRKNLADCARVRIIPNALGTADGMLTFYPNAWSQSSSALSVTETMQKEYPFSRQLAPIEVPVVRLDTSLSKETLESPVLLKLDLQGYELEALKGATGILPRINHILLEVAARPMYKGQPEFHDVRRHLADAGFEFLQFLEGGTQLPSGRSEGDAVFVRQDVASHHN
ncbi:MAG: FkbM family methyltransferase [Phycisphaerae bacterium]